MHSFYINSCCNHNTLLWPSFCVQTSLIEGEIVLHHYYYFYTITTFKTGLCISSGKMTITVWEVGRPCLHSQNDFLALPFIGQVFTKEYFIQKISKSLRHYDNYILFIFKQNSDMKIAALLFIVARLYEVFEYNYEKIKRRKNFVSNKQHHLLFDC